jgi:subtilisin family serine protease
LSRTDGPLSYNNTYVFVFDTGVEQHPLLNINTEFSRDFTVPRFLRNGKENPLFKNGWSTDSLDPRRNRLNGHGTHVAGTIGANNPTFAVAPGAPIVAYKILPGTNVTMEKALTELENFRDNHPSANIIVNMSIGFAARTPQLRRFETTINRLALEKNITFVAAAGNSARDSSTSSPARLEGAITVASYDNALNQFSWFSNFGNSVDIMAPGENIFSTWLNNGFNSIDGTSMATPIVAGACVNMIAVESRRNPNTILNPRQIKNRLRYDAINSLNNNSAGVYGQTGPSLNPIIRMPILACLQPTCTGNPGATGSGFGPFPTTFPYSVFIGRHQAQVQNY